jgi:16S rRNA (adenine1518-N6/adenine1519-N6)-dimethyltransferase
MPAHSIAQVRQLLDAAGLSPQHRFGQNFLIDLNLMRKLVDAAELSAADVVLEVGPGTGSLTELLLESGAGVISCEIDRGLATLNRERLGDRENFTLIEGDALATKHTLNPEILAALDRVRRASSLPRGNETDEQAGSLPYPESDSVSPTPNCKSPAATVKLVANLPYQIATPC